VRTGKALSAPVCIDLETFPVQIHDGAIYIQIPTWQSFPVKRVSFRTPPREISRKRRSQPAQAPVGPSMESLGARHPCLATLLQDISRGD